MTNSFESVIHGSIEVTRAKKLNAWRRNLWLVCLTIKSLYRKLTNFSILNVTIKVQPITKKVALTLAFSLGPFSFSRILKIGETKHKSNSISNDLMLYTVNTHFVFNMWNFVVQIIVTKLSITNVLVNCENSVVYYKFTTGSKLWP